MAKHPRWARRFLSDADFDAIVDAIARAEAATSGEIRVHLERRVPRHRDKTPGDILARAHQVLRHLGMHRKAERHGVLIYLALEDRKLAIVGDAGIHAHVGDDYWAGVRDLTIERLRAGAPRAAIVAAVEDVGRALRRHFPKRAGDVNEPGDGVSAE